jgi:hypothetical protein
MEPISAIAISLALGAHATAWNEANDLINDAYSELKELVSSRYPKVSVNQLEQAPDSKRRRAVVEEDLAASGAGQDPELLAAARKLTELIRQHAPDAAAEIGVDLTDVGAPKATCGNCGATLDEDPSVALEERKPCPVCGSTTRRIFVEVRIAIEHMVAASGNIIIGGTETGIKPAEPWPLPETAKK